ncbi:MAG: hypothetical protein M1828_005500 [Chrysothrix sp. TS-e1954]|nr:MAG: hypothetical protein M1828_005500 [Chrysothrix sp. TS-e1954]
MWLRACLLALAVNCLSATGQEQVPLPNGETWSLAPNDCHRTSPLLDLHRGLVEIESITGNEQGVGNYLIDYFLDRNISVHQQFVDAASFSNGERRFNVYAHIGSMRETRVLLSSHIDTVPPFYPYELRENATEVWGRGSADAKASVACQITAFNELRKAGKIGEGDVGLLFVVGEETGGSGMKTANELNQTWESVIFGEPTEGKLASGHKGILGLELNTKGKSGHSGYPWLGVSANTIMIRALAAIEDLKGKLPSSEKYGNTTVNIGRIDGGVAGNVIPEEATANIALRIADGTPDVAKMQIMRAIYQATKDELHGDGNWNLKTTIAGYPPIDLDTDIDGFGEPITVNYGTDVYNLKGSHKRYLYGPGAILVAHSDHEHVAVKDLETAVTGYKKLVMAALSR